jgi:LPPG:FO 2-phospho-L-lactate transferase
VTAGAPRAVTVLAGGYGGAKLSHGLAMIADDARIEPLSIVVNTGDDLELHGLRISPDVDTVLYTLAGLANEETGWGVRDETWSAAGMLERYGAPTWFRLGDRDLATHLMRTEALRAGGTLSEVTARLARALGVRARLLPMSDEPVRTEVRTGDGWLEFQEWFVRRHHADPALELRFSGADAARPTAEVHAALAGADVIVMAPSNPFVSIGTILAVPGMADAILAADAPVVAVSPIVAGAALRGPADRMFASLAGTEPTAAGVARHYAERYPDLVDALVIDEHDAGEADAVAATGIRPVVAPSVMRTDEDRARLARAVLASAR